MFELLLTKQEFGKFSGGGGFFTYVDLPTKLYPTIIRADGVIFEDPPTIGSDTMGGTLGEVAAARSYVDFSSFMDLTSFDWTLEFTFSMINPNGNYCGIINLSYDDNYPAVQIRFADGGFGSRLQISTGQQLSNVFNLPFTKTQLTNVVKKMVLVSTSKGISVFIDDVKYKMAISTSMAYTYEYAYPSDTLKQINRITIGPSVNMSTGKMKMGPITLTGAALYS